MGKVNSTIDNSNNYIRTLILSLPSRKCTYIFTLKATMLAFVIQVPLITNKRIAWHKLPSFCQNNKAIV